MSNVFIFFMLMIVPWLATLSGSLLALRLDFGNKRLQSLLLGFAAGIMLAASVWSLIMPAFEEAGTELQGVAIVTLGFVLGCALMQCLDKLLPHLHRITDLQPEGRPSNFSRPLLLVIAVALHNIPEGLSLGIVMAAAFQEQGYSAVAAVTFGLGLALQNFPEGMAVTLPLRQAGVPEKTCRNWGIMASFAEPAAALIGWGGTALVAQSSHFFMPLLLSVAAGAMTFIVVEELIPESQETGHDHYPTYGFLVGFWVMAVMGIVAG